MIRFATQNDSDQIAGIYNYYIEHTTATFEDVPLAGEEIEVRMLAGQKLGTWLVSEHNGNVQGYAYSAPWGQHQGYRTSFETTIYLNHSYVGKGLGFGLYCRLIEELRAKRLHAAIGIIGLPNPASVALHEKVGFVKAGEFKEIGIKFDNWVDVGYWQLLL